MDKLSNLFGAKFGEGLYVGDGLICLASGMPLTPEQIEFIIGTIDESEYELEI